VAQQEKKRANNYQQQLKVIVRTLKQWKKNQLLQPIRTRTKRTNRTITKTTPHF